MANVNLYYKSSIAKITKTSAAFSLADRSFLLKLNQNREMQVNDVKNVQRHSQCPSLGTSLTPWRYLGELNHVSTYLVAVKPSSVLLFSTSTAKFREASRQSYDPGVFPRSPRKDSTYDHKRTVLFLCLQI